MRKVVLMNWLLVTSGKSLASFQTLENVSQSGLTAVNRNNSFPFPHRTGFHNTGQSVSYGISYWKEVWLSCVSLDLHQIHVWVLLQKSQDFLNHRLILDETMVWSHPPSPLPLHIPNSYTVNAILRVWTNDCLLCFVDVLQCPNNCLKLCLIVGL